MEIDKAILFPSSTEWRRWLEEYHDKEKEAWLVHYKKGSGKDSLSYDDAVEEALCFGWIDGRLKSIDNEKFILRYSPRKKNSVWSKLNRDKAEKLIRSNKMTEAGMIKINQAKANGLWDAAYTSLDKDEIPEDLKSALMGNLDALNNFEHFANSYRNMYIGWVNGAKTSQTRQQRIAEVVRRSELNKKLG
jgi:uncharacterized protein YdeI (YjbR/CyaY-like superfamily)